MGKFRRSETLTYESRLKHFALPCRWQGKEKTVKENEHRKRLFLMLFSEGHTFMLTGVLPYPWCFSTISFSHLLCRSLPEKDLGISKSSTYTSFFPPKAFWKPF
jgi:hypothetical protein